MNILQKISNGDFTNSEKCIISFMLQNPTDVLSMDLTELANAAFVSPATVSRLVKKLGYENYYELLIALARDIKATLPDINIDYNLPITKDMRMSEILTTITTLQHNVIDESLNMMDLSKLEEACLIMSEAEVIDIYGTVFWLPMVHQFKYEMKRIGRAVNIINEVSELRFNALRTNEKHCSIVVTYSGKDPYLKDVYDILMASASKTILVTSLANHYYGENTFGLTFYLCSKMQLPIVYSNISGMVSLVWLFNIFYAGIFTLNYEKNIQYIKEINKKIKYR